MVIHDSTKHKNIHFYVVCSTSFKKGIHHGVWIDANSDVEQMKMDIADMLATSLFHSQTHWHITRFEAPLPFHFLHDGNTLEELHKMAWFIGSLDVAHFGAKLLDYYDGDVNEADDAISNRYLGDFKSIRDFVKKRLREHENVSETIIKAINYKKLWQLWCQERFFAIHTPPYGVQIFRKGYGIIH